MLTYHVRGSKVESVQIPLGASITTLQGGTIRIEAARTGLVITHARNRKDTILTANIQASNDVVHVIDKVILPAA